MFLESESAHVGIRTVGMGANSSTQVVGLFLGSTYGVRLENNCCSLVLECMSLPSLSTHLSGNVLPCIPPHLP